MPPALARWLIGQGHTASHVFDLGLGGADDRTIWDHASEAGAAIVTKDEDFVVRRVLADSGPSIVWVRFGNTTRPEVIARLARHLPGILEALGRGEALVEIN
jgi:predicted nuclease of predicted toxin-antitoxin system